LPQDLPPAGALAADRDGWILGTPGTPAAAAIARRHGPRTLELGGSPTVPAAIAGPPGARTLELRGTDRVPTARARALAGVLRARGLLRWSEADRRFALQSQVEGQDGTWARAAVVAP